VQLAVVVVGLGGGTGTGAAPVVIEAARDAGAMVLCFASTPFPFEGDDRGARSREGIEALRGASDALVLVPNERLFDSLEEIPVPEAFGKATEVLASGIGATWKLLTRPGYINLDFADVRDMVRRSGGVCTLGYGDGKGKTRAPRALKALIEGPLLGHGTVLAEARSRLVSIVGGDDLTLKEVADTMAAVRAKTADACHVAMGTVLDDGWRNRLAITVLASKEWSDEPLAPPEPRAPEPDAPPVPEKPRRKGAAKRRQAQTSLGFDAAGKGRFKNVEPTILDGEDLDIPTYRRRGIRLEL
jgi:cell division protein FtsZ